MVATVLALVTWVVASDKTTGSVFGLDWVAYVGWWTAVTAVSGFCAPCGWNLRGSRKTLIPKQPSKTLRRRERAAGYLQRGLLLLVSVVLLLDPWTHWLGALLHALTYPAQRLPQHSAQIGMGAAAAAAVGGRVVTAVRASADRSLPGRLRRDALFAVAGTLWLAGAMFTLLALTEVLDWDRQTRLNVTGVGLPILVAPVALLRTIGDNRLLSAPCSRGPSGRGPSRPAGIGSGC